MRSFGIYTILEYLLSVVLVIIEISILINYYMDYLSVGLDFSNYIAFMNELYYERLYYCLYKLYGNPQYLFYIPNETIANATVSNSNDISYLDNCYSPLNFELTYPINSSTISSGVYNVTLENLNMSSVPTFIIQDAENRNNIYYIGYNDMIDPLLENVFGNNIPPNQILSQQLYQPISQSVNEFGLNILSMSSFIYTLSQIEYLFEETSGQYIDSEGENISENAIGVIEGSINQEYILSPLFSPQILAVDNNYKLHVITVYQFGDISSVETYYTANETALKDVFFQISSGSGSPTQSFQQYSQICSYL